MRFISYCDPILHVLDQRLMKLGLHHAGMTVEEISKNLQLERDVVLQALDYLDSWGYVTCKRDAGKDAADATITLLGSRVITSQEKSEWEEG